MRKLSLGLPVALVLACTPGSPEYGSCSVTPDCQVLLVCINTQGSAGILVNDAGYTYYDGGVCRKTCQTSVDCQPTSEICGINGFCSSDGGY